MGRLGIGGLAIGLAAAFLSGCGAQSGSTLPQGASAPAAAHKALGKSWMLPEASGEDLLYASDNTGNQVYVFSYPDAKLVGTLTGFYSPVGECVDKAGNIWVVNQVPSEVIEYAHGGTTPIATLTAGTWPYGCAVDDNTGNLAVVNYGDGSQATILVFPNAQNPPNAYAAPDFSHLEYGGYDDKSNFFSVGYSASLRAYALAELPNGGSGIQTIAFNETVKRANVVQWDGKLLAVGGESHSVNSRSVRIYRVSVSGSQARVKGITKLQNSGKIWQQFWIQGHTVIQDSDKVENLSFWHYPKGGAAIKTLTQLGQIWGVVVSTAPSRCRIHR